MVKRATAAVIFNEDKVLIAQRVKDLLWEFPGGKIDEGETPEECIIREIKEELSVDIKVKKFLGLIEGIYRDIPMQVFAFLADFSGGNLSLNVHKDAKWLKIDEVSKYPLVEEDAVILKQFL
jgi:8-oxo-dGTP diphosphatase